MRLVGDAARSIGHGLRRIFGKRETWLEPGPALLALAHHAGISDSWLARCGCGELLVPVMVGDDGHTEIAAIGCPLGHGAIGIICGCLPSAARPQTGG
jgi:hypothetical protein